MIQAPFFLSSSCHRSVPTSQEPCDLPDLDYSHYVMDSYNANLSPSFSQGPLQEEPLNLGTH